MIFYIQSSILHNTNFHSNS